MTTPPAVPPPREASSSDGSRYKRLLAGVVGVIVTILASYGIGRFQGAQSTNAAEERTKAEAEARSRATQEFDAQRDRAIRLEARRRLHLASVAVEEKNFGIAREHLTKCATLLERSKGIAALDDLASRIRKQPLAASDDVAAARAELASFTRAFDQALPPAEP